MHPQYDSCELLKMNECVHVFMDIFTCKVLVDPITSLLLPVVWNDVIVSCLSGALAHSSEREEIQYVCHRSHKISYKSTTEIRFRHVHGPLITGKEKGATWPSRSRSKMWCMKAAWSLPAKGISLSLSSCSRLPWKRLSRSSLGRQGELWICSSVSTAKSKKIMGTCILSLFVFNYEFNMNTLPVLNVRKKSSTCWHFGSSWMRSNWKGTMWMLSSEINVSPTQTDIKRQL